MSYVVQAQAGDCLCSIARRNGYSNCGTVRSHVANAALLDRPLQVGENVTIPGFRDSWYYSKVATGRRWTVRWAWPVAVPQPVQIRIVRKTAAAAAPSPAQVPADLGISRFITRSSDIGGNDNWPAHNQRDFDAGSHSDPNTFSLEIQDPNATGNQVRAYVEALQPLYGMHGNLTGHQRFQGNQRAARRLPVVCEHLGALPAGCFWSGELRLVIDAADRNQRPYQTLLVTDLFDSAGAGADIQILDQNVRAVYEYAACPRNAGEKCILAWHERSLRRGRSVGVEAWILRQNPDGTDQDNGLVTQAAVQGRIRRNCRRTYAQEELTFNLASLATIDPPCDGLTVADPNGDLASGHRQADQQAGRIGFRITIQPFNGGQAVQHNVGPINVQANDTPLATAQALAHAIGQIAHLNAAASQNAAECGQARGSADVVIHCDNGHATLDQLTQDGDQDSTQKARLVNFNVNAVDDEQPANEWRKGGPPMRRLLFKSVQTQANRLSVFVVQEARGGLTTGSLWQINPHVDAAVRNCISMNAGNMDPDLDHLYLTLPHEMGHALADADHVPMDVEGALMQAGQAMGGNWYDNKRVSGPGLANHDFAIVSDNGNPVAGGHVAHGHLRATNVQTTMHALIAQNGSLQFQNR